MKTQHFWMPILMLFFLAACTTQPQISATPTQPITAPTETPDEDPAGETETLPAATALPDCLGEVVSPLGQSIAEEYETASYEQIMTWFCNGAEFEDILVALETETQTGVSAEEMLAMLAKGATWEEIWQRVGLTD